MQKSSASQKDTKNLKVTYGKQDLSAFFVENLARALKLGQVQVKYTGKPGEAEEPVKSGKLCRLLSISCRCHQCQTRPRDTRPAG